MLFRIGLFAFSIGMFALHITIIAFSIGIFALRITIIAFSIGFYFLLNIFFFDEQKPIEKATDVARFSPTVIEEAKAVAKRKRNQNYAGLGEIDL